MTQDHPDRKLIKTFNGLPEGAGIYEMPDGSQRFFNCAPGQPAAEPEDMPCYETFYEITNPDTGEIRFIEPDPFYTTLKQALMAAGKDIQDITTEAQLDHVLSVDGYGNHIKTLIEQKWLNRTPKTTRGALTRAIILGHHDEAQQLRDILDRRERLGIRAVK